MFLNGFLKKDPFTATLLGSFIESPSGKVSLYAYSHLLNSSSLMKEPTKSAIQLVCYLSGIVKFGPLKFPNMSISAEIYSEDFSTCVSNRSSIPGLKISATFNQQETLGRFFTCVSSDSLQIFLPSDSQNNTEGILNATVALLGDSFRAQVTISNTSLSFQRDVDLFSNYRLSLNGSSQLQPWDFLSLKVTGIFGKSAINGDQNALENKVKGLINEYINVVVRNTFQRLKVLQRTEDKMKARIDRLKLRLVQAENNTHLAVNRYLWALKTKQAALKDVENAEKKLSNSSQELNQLKASLERLCSVIECPYVCVTGTFCKTCYKDLISKEQGLCPATCHNVLKQRVPPFSEDGLCLEENCEHSGLNKAEFLKCNVDQLLKATVTTGLTVGLSMIGVPPPVAYVASNAAVNAAYECHETKSEKKTAVEGGKEVSKGVRDGTKDSKKLASKATARITSPVASIGKDALVDSLLECVDYRDKWACKDHINTCPKEVFKYAYTNVPYQCEISCQVNVVKDTIASPCCREVNCASRIKELKCKEKNAFCRIAREKATSKLNAANKRIVKPLGGLQQAKKVLNAAEIELAKRKLELESATSKRDTLRRAHDAIVKAAIISQRSREQNRALIQDAIKLAQLWNSTNGTCLVDIKEISFDVTLSSPSETQFPVKFKIASAREEKTIFPIVNFASLNDSLGQTAKQIVKALFGNVSVVLRSGHPLNQVASAQDKGRRKRAIDERGSDVTRLVAFKKKCALVTNYQRALNDIISTLYDISTESLQLVNNVTNHTLERKHAEDQDFAVNVTQAAELGLSNKDIDDSVKAVPADEEVINLVSLFELANVTNHNKVEKAIDMVFRDWEASMETVFNRTSLECIGFVDCMEDFVDNLLYLYHGVDIPGAVRLQKQIAILGAEVKSFLSHEDLSVAETTEKSLRILQLLQDIKDENVFCAVAPNITHNPAAMKDLKIGQTLELSCKATGDPAPSYRWRKNGVLLPGSNTETLRIDKVTTNDSGNYTCEVYNHIKVEPSTPSYIIVHPPPTMVYQPPSNLIIPLNTGFYMRCNATSITKPLRYQWLFTPLNGDGHSLVPNGNFSVLSFNSVQEHGEGFYKCNVSNPFDYILSHSVRVRVLGFSLVVPSFGLYFEIVGDNRSLSDAYEDSNKLSNGGNPLHANENFKQDVKLAFMRNVNNLVDLPSNAVEDLTIQDCEIVDEDNNISCNVSFRLRSFNMTGRESTNRTEEENAVSVMDSAKQLQRAAALLVNESNARNISLNVRGVSLKIDPASWGVGEYISLCPTGQVLFHNNFVCGR